MRTLTKTLVTTLAALSLGSAAQAQEVTLKVHHFLPSNSYANTMFIQPWCERIQKESNQRMKCQIYPSMQLGGTPAQLVSQVRNGVVDVIWTLQGYTAGMFPLLEVFELPFMMQDPEATSKAVWDYTQQYALGEFKDMKPLALHVHGDGVFHVIKKPIKTLDDVKGLKLRAPTRLSNKLLSALGATPVAMPVPATSEALSKGVIDGALMPYEVVPSVKLQEMVKFHSETDPAEPAIYTSVFMFAMNKARYEGLPEDLRKVIDRNSGQALSGQIGKTFLAADAEGKKAAAANHFNVIPKAELQRFQAAGQTVTDTWVKDMDAKGHDGKQLLNAARSLIAKHSTK
jgi:TRAP-type C4-dicarboxylate transport system substrate-binding protein